MMTEVEFAMYKYSQVTNINIIRLLLLLLLLFNDDCGPDKLTL
jgi:hypothetical protein